MAAPYELEGKTLELIHLTVFGQDSRATLYLTVCENVGIADNQVLKCVTFGVVNCEFCCSTMVR